MEPTTRKLPLILVDIDDMDLETGVNFVARTATPAIEKMAMCFTESEKPKEYKFIATDNERRIVTGPLMIPNLPIYRNDKDGEYYVSFSEAAIEKICVKFMKNGFMHNMNDEHNSKKIIDAVYLFESILADNKRGISHPAGWPDMPNGTWYGSYRIENDVAWEEFKNGNFGFSVEGIFMHKKIADKEECELLEIHDRVLNLSQLLKQWNELLD